MTLFQILLTFRDADIKFCPKEQEFPGPAQRALYRDMLSLGEGLSARCVIKELSPKEDTNKGEIFQTMMERHKSSDIKDFDFREVHQNMHAFESQCGYNETNYIGVTTPIAKISLVEEINSIMNPGITSF